MLGIGKLVSFIFKQRITSYLPWTFYAAGKKTENTGKQSNNQYSKNIVFFPKNDTYLNKSFPLIEVQKRYSCSFENQKKRVKNASLKEIGSDLKYVQNFFKEAVTRVQYPQKKLINSLKEKPEKKPEELYNVSTDFLLDLNCSSGKKSIYQNIFFEKLMQSSIAKKFPKLYKNLLFAINSLLQLQDKTSNQLYSGGVNIPNTLNQYGKNMGLHSDLADELQVFCTKYLETSSLYEADAIERAQLLLTGSTLFITLREGSRVFVCLNGIDLNSVFSQDKKCEKNIAANTLKQILALIINAPETTMEKLLFVNIVEGESEIFSSYELLLAAATVERDEILTTQKLHEEDELYIKSLEEDELVQWFINKQRSEYQKVVKSSEYFEQAKDNVFRNKISMCIDQTELETPFDVDVAFSNMKKIKNATRKAEAAIEILLAKCKEIYSRNICVILEEKKHKDLNVFLDIVKVGVEDHLNQKEQAALNVFNCLANKELHLIAKDIKVAKKIFSQVIKYIDKNKKDGDFLYCKLALALRKIAHNIKMLGVMEDSLHLLNKLADEASLNIINDELRYNSLQLNSFQENNYEQIDKDAFGSF